MLTNINNGDIINKKKIILISILVIFIIGMTAGCANAKTYTLKTKKDKYVTKKVGKYTIQTYRWKTPYYQEIDVFVMYKNGKLLKKNKYSSKYHYKYKGKSKYTPWRHGAVDCTYHKYQTGVNVKVGNVKVRI